MGTNKIKNDFENALLENFPNIKVLRNEDLAFSEGRGKLYELNGHTITYRIPDWRDYHLEEIVVDNIGGYIIDRTRYPDFGIERIIDKIKTRCL